MAHLHGSSTEKSIFFYFNLVYGEFSITFTLIQFHFEQV